MTLNIGSMKLPYLHLCVAAICFVGKSNSDPSTKVLVENILGNYTDIDRLVPPTTMGEKMSLKIGFSLLGLEFCQHTQILSTVMVQKMVWNDPLLKWKPDNGSGILNIALPVNRIWKPNIVLQNSAEEPTITPYDDYIMAEVMSNGTVSWTQIKSYKSYCQPNFSKFPWDEQACMLIFRPVPQSENRLYFHRINADITRDKNFKDNNHWKCSECSPFGGSTSNQLEFKICLERNSFLLQDAVILSTGMLSILTLMIFFIPPQMDAKINLGMLVFAGFTLLLLHISLMVPLPTHNIPKLVTFLFTGQIIVGVVMALSIFTSYLARKGSQGVPMPPMLRNIFNVYIGALVCTGPIKLKRVEEEAGVSDREIHRQWELFAQVLDRVFLIIFTTAWVIYAISLRFNF